MNSRATDKYHFYTVSSHAWDAMLAAIKQAKHSIYWESYILRENTPAHNFFNALASKARQGVKVKIIADALGSFFMKSRARQKLIDAGAEVLFFNRLIPWWNPYRFKRWWLNRNHKKILIVDEKVGFIGGVNVGKRYVDWLDLQVKLQGAIVRYLVRSFAVSYRLCGGKDEIKYRSVFKKSKIRVFHQSPLTKRSILKKYYKQSCRIAKKSIIIATPYFIPQSWLLKCLRRAAKKGIRVDIILPKKSDYWITNLANYTSVSLLAQSGANFFFTKEIIHAKALLVDDKEGMVGSQNVDYLSFEHNFESGIVFQRRDMINQLKKILEEWQKNSERIIFEKNQKWHRKLKEVFLAAVRSFL